MVEVEAHITGTVWKIECKVGDVDRGGRHRRHPRVDEDGDARRGRGPRHGQGDPRARRARPSTRATRSSSWSSARRAIRHELAGGVDSLPMAGQLEIDRPLDGVLRLTISNPAKRNALDHAILDAIADGARSLRRRRRAASCSPARTGCSRRATTSATSPPTCSPSRPRSSSRTRSARALAALDACRRADARRAPRLGDRRRPRARARLRPADRRARGSSSACRPRSSASSTRTPACGASSTRSASRARASCSCSAATSTRRRALTLGARQLGRGRTTSSRRRALETRRASSRPTRRCR